MDFAIICKLLINREFENIELIEDIRNSEGDSFSKWILNILQSKKPVDKDVDDYTFKVPFAKGD